LYVLVNLVSRLKIRVGGKEFLPLADTEIRVIWMESCGLGFIYLFLLVSFGQCKNALFIQYVVCIYIHKSGCNIQNMVEYSFLLSSKSNTIANYCSNFIHWERKVMFLPPKINKHSMHYCLERNSCSLYMHNLNTYIIEN